MKDKYGRPLKAGDKIVYAVRDGSCSAALNDATVLRVEPDYITVQNATGKKFHLNYPERICLHRD